MRYLTRIMTAACLCIAVAAPTLADDVEPITLKAADGVVIHGVYYKAPHPKALILLFHQAGSGKGEYAAIAPRLVSAGYSAMAIDQRSGGTLFGTNETVAALSKSADYLEAKPDLEAALAWGVIQKLPIAIWGSSYSSSLVFVVAAEHPDLVKAVLAFSPGEYFDDKTLIRNAAKKVTVPVFVTSANTPDEINAARDILAASPSATKVQYIPRAGGVHGSSTLLPGRNQAGAEANWSAVLQFLGKAFPMP
ncbi:dienelactone hydrolase family protein [Pinirhizobacter sp.]|jgi:dienelactone hydrolase|uniref:dienelactone hydrolase family protein n=1 Tax=Pinirhizobacter sp. TaxID=2950432 RepID=UPI002F42AD35